MSSFRSQHPQHSHPQHRTEVLMKNDTHEHSVSARAALMATLTRIAVEVVLEAAILVSIFRRMPGTFERESTRSIARLGRGRDEAETRRRSPIRLAVGVPPPLLPRAGAAPRSPEGSAWL